MWKDVRRLKLGKLDTESKDELSMVEVAHAILQKRGDVLSFADLTNEIQKYMGASNANIRSRIVQFYTDLNTDGSFISLGDNLWGLRTWYPYNSINEATVKPEDEDATAPKQPRRKIDAFLDDASENDDVIDYNESSDDENLNSEERGYREDLKHSGNDNPLTEEEFNKTQNKRKDN